jgi:hypothetical protein
VLQTDEKNGVCKVTNLRPFCAKMRKNECRLNLQLGAGGRADRSVEAGGDGETPGSAISVIARTENALILSETKSRRDSH